MDVSFLTLDWSLLMRWKMAQIMTCCMFVRSRLVVKFVRSRLVVKEPVRSRKVDGRSSSGREGSQADVCEAGSFDFGRKETNERSGPEKMVNRGMSGVLQLFQMFSREC